jgi:site-specific recombinase XerD
MTLTEASEHFINYCRAERQASPSTLAKYQDCFNSWLIPWFGSKELATLNRSDILGMRQSMVDRQLSVARQYSVIVCLKGLLKFCRSGLVVVCMDPTEILLPKRCAPHVEFLDNEEILRMLEGIDTGTFAGIRLRALVEVLLATGMRAGEALSLKRDIFEADRKETEIVGKGQLKRQVFFSPRCRFWIRHYLTKRVDDNPWLFVTTGYPVRKWAQADLSRFFILLRKKAGIDKKLTPHLLRHTFCTNLLQHGADITHIKDLAGHQDIQMTARYYLGKDQRVLRQIVDRCLDYRVEESNCHDSRESELGPQANIHRT